MVEPAWQMANPRVWLAILFTWTREYVSRAWSRRSQQMAAIGLPSRRKRSPSSPFFTAWECLGVQWGCCLLGFSKDLCRWYLHSHVFWPRRLKCIYRSSLLQRFDLGFNAVGPEDTVPELDSSITATVRRNGFIADVGPCISWDNKYSFINHRRILCEGRPWGLEGKRWGRAAL